MYYKACVTSLQDLSYTRPYRAGALNRSYWPLHWWAWGLFRLLVIIALVPLLRRRDGVVPTIVVLLIAVYMWTYSLSWYIAPMLAWAIAYRETPKPEKAPAKEKQQMISPAYGMLATRMRDKQSVDAT